MSITHLEYVKNLIAADQNAIPLLQAELHVNLPGGWHMDSEADSDQITITTNEDVTISMTAPGGIPQAILETLQAWLAPQP